VSVPVTYNDRVVGTCSLCGGPVCVPIVYMSTVPPTPTCHQCGAVPVPDHGPVIPMHRPAAAPRYVPCR
jgi:hypothetical protein